MNYFPCIGQAWQNAIENVANLVSFDSPLNVYSYS